MQFAEDFVMKLCGCWKMRFAREALGNEVKAIRSDDHKPCYELDSLMSLCCVLNAISGDYFWWVIKNAIRSDNEDAAVDDECDSQEGDIDE